MKSLAQAPLVETKMKKAPQAPRRFKSACMFFSTEKHKQIRSQMSARNEKVSSLKQMILHHRSSSVDVLFLSFHQNIILTIKIHRSRHQKLLR